MPRAHPSRHPHRALALAALVPLLGAWSAATPELCIVSRHSGELLAGADFSLADVHAAPLARSVRVGLEAGRSPGSSPDGMEVLVEPDRVVVRRGDRSSVPPSTRGDAAVEVQVFGLVGAEQVRVRCPGLAVRVQGGELEELGPGWQALRPALGTGSILCSGGPWQVRVAGSPPRPYAGVFSFRPLPPRQPEPGSTAREARARRGSEVIFRTTLSAYVSGVLAAEHARLDGQAGLALAQVIAHDARVERHPGRPLCDTTHCQAFLGTVPPTPEVRQALALPELPTVRWLPYSRGGDEPWEVRRSMAEVKAALGEVERFGGSGRILEVVRSTGVERVPCEPVRAALRLPSCPTDGVEEGETVRIRGHGRGHGLGLDVEAARTSGLSAAALLQRAYGLDVTP